MKMGDDAMLEKARQPMIIGRNPRQCSQDELLRFVEAPRTILPEYPSQLGSVLP